MGAAWVRGGLFTPGDVIANLYSFGGMYGGFQYVNKAIENAPAPVVHLPLSSACPLDMVEHEIEAFGATVVIAPVFHITRLAAHISKSGRGPALSVRMILFSGESLSASVAATWREVFPARPSTRPCIRRSTAAGWPWCRARAPTPTTTGGPSTWPQRLFMPSCRVDPSLSYWPMMAL